MLNFIKTVEEFHLMFNHPVLEKFQLPKDRVDFRINLIKEELEELKQACENNDLVEIADAFCDLQYVLSGAILEFGLQDKFLDLFSETHRSNMSKACKDLDEAVQTVEYWEEKGQPCHWEQKDEMFLVYRNSDGKVLKSVNYSPVNLQKILDL